jgi:hypothetical protein
MRTFGGRVSVIFQGVSAPRRASLSLTRTDGTVCCLFAPLSPGQPDDGRVEDGQGAQPERRRQDDAVQLVDDEDQQEADQQGVGPELVAQQGGHEHDLGDAVEKEIHGGEDDCRAGQAVGIAQQVAGDEVVGVLGQLVLGQPYGQTVDRRRGDDEQEQSADSFQDAVESFEDDPDFEDPVESVSGLEPAHDA